VILRDYIRSVPDFPKPGIDFKDITPLLQHPSAFQNVIGQMQRRWQGTAGAIAALDARGFIFGSALAHTLKLPFIPIRKKGKLPFSTASVSYGLEYGEDTVEIHTDACAPGARVLIVDDLLATGGTAGAAARLIRKINGEVVGYAFVIELTALQGRSKLGDYPIQSIITYV
jgi:adenine phosphoribosyltransferase